MIFLSAFIHVRFSGHFAQDPCHIRQLPLQPAQVPLYAAKIPLCASPIPLLHQMQEEQEIRRYEAPALFPLYILPLDFLTMGQQFFLNVRHSCPKAVACLGIQLLQLAEDMLHIRPTRLRFVRTITNLTGPLTQPAHRF